MLIFQVNWETRQSLYMWGLYIIQNCWKTWKASQENDDYKNMAEALHQEKKKTHTSFIVLIT